MSVIAVKKYKDRIEIASDTQVTIGWNSKEENSIAKLGKLSPDLVVGCCGDAGLFVLLREYCKTNTLRFSGESAIIEFFTKFHRYAKAEHMDATDYKVDENTFILIHKHIIYAICGYYTRKIKDYYATGSGGIAAFVALDLGSSVVKAVRVACKHDIYCGLPVKHIIVKKD
jgi:ATP-dependent protease HslVU (ClpYQ) peptidase subunit